MNGVGLPLRRPRRPEDRRLSRSAGKLRGGGRIRARRGARRFLLSGRIRAAPGREVCERNRGGQLASGARNGGKERALNGREVEWIEGNAFDLLREYAAANRRYDTIVLDPPAFAKTKRDLEKALGGYKELNLRAMKMLRPGGILVTCSCSFHVGAVGLPGSGGRRGPRRPQIPAPAGEPGSGEGSSNAS